MSGNSSLCCLGHILIRARSMSDVTALAKQPSIFSIPSKSSSSSPLTLIVSPSHSRCVKCASVAISHTDNKTNASFIISARLWLFFIPFSLFIESTAKRKRKDEVKKSFREWFDLTGSIQTAAKKCRMSLNNCKELQSVFEEVSTCLDSTARSFYKFKDTNKLSNAALWSEFRVKEIERKLVIAEKKQADAEKKQADAEKELATANSTIAEVRSAGRRLFTQIQQVTTQYDNVVAECRTLRVALDCKDRHIHDLMQRRNDHMLQSHHGGGPVLQPQYFEPAMQWGSASNLIGDSPQMNLSSPVKPPADYNRPLSPPRSTTSLWK